MRQLLSPIVAFLVLSLGAIGWAADAPQGTEPFSTVPLANPTKDMTPAQVDATNAALADIKAKHDLIFGSGSMSPDLYKQVEAKRVAEYTTWLEQYKGFAGANPNEQASVIPIGEGFSLTSKYIQSPRHFRDTRFLGGASAFEVIDANKNILDDENRRVNKIANKLEKSRFACGQFDWIVQLRGMFNKAALTKYVDKLAESALAAAPMALLANISPTLYEIVKFMRSIASMELDADKIQCNQLEAAFTDVGRRATRGDGYADCIKANQNLGIGEAHRICNQGSSPFDGIENTAGKIVGLNSDNPNINITKIISDRLGDDPSPASVANTKAITDASAKKQAADAEVANNPDPGPAPNFPAGSPEMIQWTEKSTKHQNALADQDQATTQLSTVVGISNDASDQSSVWSTLRNSVASNLGNIIGNIDLSLKSDVQFGRQRQYQLILQYKHQAFKMALDLCEQLEAHFPLIIADNRDAASVALSYERIHAFMYGTMKAPWGEGNHPGLTLEEKLARCGYDTIDKLSVLWTQYQLGAPDSLARTVWADKYRTVEAINEIMLYEIYDYLWNRAQIDKDTVLGELASMPIGKSSDVIYKKVEANLNEYIALISRKRDECIPTLVQCIMAINTFPLVRGKFPGEDSGRFNAGVENSAVGR